MLLGRCVCALPDENEGRGRKLGGTIGLNMYCNVTRVKLWLGWTTGTGNLYLSQVHATTTSGRVEL